MYGPDCSDSDEGLSDDNEYYEFKQRLKKKQKESFQNKIESEAEQKKQQLQTLFSAISYGREDSIFNDFDNGLNIDVDLDSEWTPLLLACTGGNFNIVSEFVKRGANVNQTRDGFTPLMLLCKIKNTLENEEKDILPCLKLLLQKGADVNAIDRKRRTAIMFAASNGYLQVVKLLLPLVDKEAEDNQSWTALFWAVDGNNLEVVQLLLEEDFSYEKADLHGNTIADIAHSNGFEDILNLLPKDPDVNDEFYSYLNNNQTNFEDIFSSLKQNEKPQLFNEVCKILFGCKSEALIPLLAKSQIGLSDFLSVNDTQLKELGVILPFQRNRILGGLFKFHKKPFQPKSVPFVRRSDLFTNIDVSALLLSYIRQQIAMEASLKFMLQNYNGSANDADLSELIVLVRKNRQQVKTLKTISARFVKETAQWDLFLKPADKIITKRRNISWANLCISVTIISLVIWFRIR